MNIRVLRAETDRTLFKSTLQYKAEFLNSVEYVDHQANLMNPRKRSKLF